VVPDLEKRSFIARDGTRIGYQFRRGATDDAPAVVFSNGLGGTFEAFRHLYAALPGYRVLCWDYRGLYSSAAPSDPLANTVVHQVEDLLELLDLEQVERAVFVGWSMGVQVNFELMRHHADRVVGLMAVNGTFGRPFRTVLGLNFIEKVIPVLLRVMKAQSVQVGRVAGRFAGSELLITAMQKLGMVSQTLDVDAFRDVAAGFGSLDWAIYSDLLDRLNQHDAEDVLATIKVPTTIVTGDKDILTPPSTATRLQALIPDARLRVIAGGTHYTPVEYPEIVREELHRLLARVPGWQLGPATE